MTPARRQRKLWLAGFGLRLAALAIAGAAAGAAKPVRATEQVVVDRHRGLAISGFDPVAYFTLGTAALGKSELEYTFAGAVWRFRNEGNRAAFKADPQVYMPRFGGHDPIDVARGVAVPGHPELWFVTGARLYLFHTPESRAAFIVDAERTIATADRKWPAVRLTLSP
jgi:hypothetical protein